MLWDGSCDFTNTVSFQEHLKKRKLHEGVLNLKPVSAKMNFYVYYKVFKIHFNGSWDYGKMNVWELRCENKTLLIRLAKKEIYNKFIYVFIIDSTTICLLT